MIKTQIANEITYYEGCAYSCTPVPCGPGPILFRRYLKNAKIYLEKNALHKAHAELQKAKHVTNAIPHLTDATQLAPGVWLGQLTHKLYFVCTSCVREYTTAKPWHLYVLWTLYGAWCPKCKEMEKDSIKATGIAAADKLRRKNKKAQESRDQWQTNLHTPGAAVRVSRTA